MTSQILALTRWWPKNQQVSSDWVRLFQPQSQKRVIIYHHFQYLSIVSQSSHRESGISKGVSGKDKGPCEEPPLKSMPGFTKPNGSMATSPEYWRTYYKWFMLVQNHSNLFGSPIPTTNAPCIIPCGLLVDLFILGSHIGYQKNVEKEIRYW